MRRIFVVLMAISGLLLLTPGWAVAGGAPVINETQHFSAVTETFRDVDPCTGVRVFIKLTYSGVSHFTLLPSGSGHFTDTQVGTFVFRYKGSHEKAHGTFTDWDGGNGLFAENGNPIGKVEFSFILNGRGTRSDGSSFSFHQNGHTLLDEVGNVKLDFIKAHCN